jgi:hypothetical protein
LSNFLNFFFLFAEMNPLWPSWAAPAAAPSEARPFNMVMLPTWEEVMMGSQVPGTNLTETPDLVPELHGSHPEEKAPPVYSVAIESAQCNQQLANMVSILVFLMEFEDLLLKF